MDQATQHRWLIGHLNAGPNVIIGYVEASNENSAIEQAIEKFKIDPTVAAKLTAQKTKTMARRRETVS